LGQLENTVKCNKKYKLCVTKKYMSIKKICGRVQNPVWGSGYCYVRVTYCIYYIVYVYIYVRFLEGKKNRLSFKHLIYRLILVIKYS